MPRDLSAVLPKIRVERKIMAAPDANPASPRRCSRCGAELPAHVPPEQCPKCLLQAALPTEAAPPKTAKMSDTPAPTSSRGLPQPGDELGRYRIARLLGEGGMGAVFEAEDLESGRRVALKVLSQKLDSPDARERFFREGRMAASINHPNSVYVFGTEEIGGTPVIAMELVAGGTLQDRVQKRGPLPVGEAVDSVLQIITGLEAAQRLGVLHRDIKPSNCFVDVDGTIKVGDFGLSISTDVRTEPALTKTGSFLGTPAFCSPEQLRGDELNVRSDMYSVGATLFYLLTGHTPFEGKTTVQLMAAALERRAPSPAKFRPGVPKGLANVVLRCLEKQPGDRFRNYHELEQALAPYGSAAPTPATLGLRALAGFIDQIVLSIFTVCVMWLFHTSPLDYMNLIGRSSLAAIGTLFGTAFIYILYYTLLEGMWGAAAGKALCRLRVVKLDRNAPGFGRAFLRATIYVVAPILPFWLCYARNPADYFAAPHTVGYTVASLNYVILALLFCLARRRNGFASVHDLLTKTRVISREALASRPELAVQELPPPPVEGRAAVGPYHVLETLEPSAEAQWLLGYDLRLLRKVWLRVVPSGTPPVPAKSRNIGRPGRLRWLAGRRLPDENWDAFEAAGGKPLLQLVQERQSWSRVRFWLYDLARELAAASKDGTLPAVLALDRVWVTGDGRAKLLDFPAPGLAPSAASGEMAVPPCRFLADVATVTLAGRPNAVADPDAPVAIPLPLHVRNFLDRLPQFPNADSVAGALKPLLQRLAEVTRLRRAAIVAGCLAFPVAVCFASVFVAKMFQALDKTSPGLLQLNAVLQERKTMNYPWMKSHPHASDRQFAIFIASHYQGVVTNKTIWTSPFAMSMINGESRRFAEQSVARYPVPTAEEIKDANKVLKEPADMSEAFDYAKKPWFPFFVAGVTTAIYVCLPALIAAMLFRGGLVLLVARVTFVRSDGVRASRLRVFWRGLVAWSPVLAGLVIVACLKALVGLFATALLYFLFMGVLAAVSVTLPGRGLQDRLAGTWPVPR